MIFTQDRNKLRQFYLDVWQKHLNGHELEPLEKMIAKVIEWHPEYHQMLEKGEAAVAQEFMPENGQSNPFLHMGMHLGLQEQLTTQRPTGIIEVYQALLKKKADAHEVEHLMMNCLGEMMWMAQQNKTMPDEAQYLECLKRLV